MKARIASLLVVFGIGCTKVASDPPPQPAPPASASASVDSQNTAPLPPIEFIEDDVDAATARAKEEKKALFVDVWAPWCHTCLSMKSYVLGEPALRPLASRVVFASIDGDRETSAKFLESHAMNVWPTFFMIDPDSGAVAGTWLGSASLTEMRSFIEESLATIDAARAGSLAEDDPVRLIATAKSAQAERDPKRAASLFERAVSKLKADDPRRSGALEGWLFALYSARDHKTCGEVGARYLGDVKGVAVPADFASVLLACSSELPPEEKGRIQTAAIARLRALTASPSPEASADDRADAWSILAEALGESGDEAGAKKALETKLAILEKAAAEAPSKSIAATYDYGLSTTYVMLGKGDKAVELLSARERDMPDSYEPPARLASVLFKLGRNDEAKAAIDRASAKAYGPRKLGYLRLRANILAKLGDAKGAIETLRQEVAGWEALPKGQANPAKLENARKQLAEAEAALSQKKPGRR